MPIADLELLPSQVLRAETAAAHRSIEGAVPALSEGFDRQSYLKLLEKFYGFYRPLEESLSPHPATQEPALKFSQRLKTHLLARDLTHFGHDPQDLERIPRHPFWLNSPTKGEVLGILYVMEGSSLGGQVITRHLREKFPELKDAGLAYYDAYGTNTGSMWKSFQAVLNSQLRDPQSLEAAVQSAKRTFVLLGYWLRNP